MDEYKYDYTTVNVTIDANDPSGNNSVRVPDGEVVAIGAICNTEPTEIINLSLLDNNNEILRPSDVRFSQKTSGGDWLSCLRPVSDISGGRDITARLTALTATRAKDYTVQVLFMIKKPAY